ncbi:MAG TPA: hypothetical protein V6D11_02445 [Waterburya sp.]
MSIALTSKKQSQLAKRLGYSDKTVETYRRRGLVTFATGRWILTRRGSHKRGDARGAGVSFYATCLMS